MGGRQLQMWGRQPIILANFYIWKLHEQWKKKDVDRERCVCPWGSGTLPLDPPMVMVVTPNPTTLELPPLTDTCENVTFSVLVGGKNSPYAYRPMVMV